MSEVGGLVAEAREKAGSGPVWRLDLLLRKLADALERSEARGAELEGWAASVREQAYTQPYAGARRECRFCGRMDHKPHDSDCFMADESKEGGA